MEVTLQQYQILPVHNYGYEPTDDGRLYIADVTALMDLGSVLYEIAGPERSMQPLSYTGALPTRITLFTEPSVAAALAQYGIEFNPVSDTSVCIELTVAQVLEFAAYYHNCWVSHSGTWDDPFPFDRVTSTLTDGHLQIYLPAPLMKN